MMICRSLPAGPCRLQGGGLRLGAAARPPRRPISTPPSAAPSGGASVVAQSLTITRPDDWHLHLRDGESLKSVVPYSARQFGRAIIMPNLQPPVTTTEMVFPSPLQPIRAVHYREKIMAAVPDGVSFEPLMTLYLTDSTPPEEIEKAKAAGVKALKLYPAGATTNSAAGVTNIDLTIPTLEAMQEAGMPLLVHGEVVSPDIDIFDRERVFIHEKLIPLLTKMPGLKVVMEHITTQDAAEFVTSAPDNVAATVTPQHMLMNRNELFKGGVRVHNFCLPVLKRERHRAAVAEAVTSGSAKFFLGTDSAPHPRGAKECACGCAGIFSAHAAMPLYATAFERAGHLDRLEAFASHHGPDFYGLPRNTDTVTLVKEEWEVPAEYDFGDSTVVPMWAGEPMPWKSV